MRLQETCILPAALLLLACLVGCPAKTAITPSAKKEAPLPGCELERLEDAEQAARQLRGHSQAYVYKIDGELATCKFEVFYKPDEKSEETLVWSVKGDSVVDEVNQYAKELDISINPNS